VSDTVANDQAGEARIESTILYIRQGDQKDGYAEITVAPDGNSAIASFFPPAPGGSFLLYENAIARLEDSGITNGILHDAIKDAIFKTNTTHSAIRNILIAQGTPSKDEIPEHIILRKDLLERRPEIDPNQARVDWHSISVFTIVQIKEPIARRIQRVEGLPGLDIHGQEIPFKVQKMQPFSPGDNVIEHPTGFFAGKSGRLSINSRGEISIEEVLILKNGVDFTTGNITFPGDVILKGKIADGFKIYAGGSLISSEVVDVSEIVCKNDMIAQSGIEGRQKGAIRIGGSLTAKYIQNCRVAVRGDITVPGSIVQSKVYSMGMIKMGETGKIVGCECIVIGGIQALDIGSPRGAKTYIRCGTDFTVQQELDIANEQLKLISIKLQKAEEIYKEEPLPDIKEFIEEAKVRKREITSRIPGYLAKIDKNDKAIIEVHGTIYPGTEIEICHVAHRIDKEQKQVVFRLDKIKGMIITEPYKRK
jgi:uncharacterized protein